MEGCESAPAHIDDIDPNVCVLCIGDEPDELERESDELENCNEMPMACQQINRAAKAEDLSLPY